MKIIKIKDLGVNEIAIEVEYNGVKYKGCLTEEEEKDGTEINS